jgi:hypothetical protein
MSNEDIDNERNKRKKKSSSDIDELREVAEVLPELFGALNDSIPKLISGLIGSVYSPESAGNMAKGIGQFYSNLVAEGIPEEVALDMTKKFVNGLDFSKLISMVGEEASDEVRRKRKVVVDIDDEDFDEEFDD